MSKHSPEPWHVQPGFGTIYSWLDGVSNCIAVVHHKGTSMGSECNKEDAWANRHRIVACVNALAGIDDPEAFVKRAKAAIALQEGNAPDLYGACKGLLNAIHDSMALGAQLLHAAEINAAVAAIKKAEGGAV